MDKKVKGITKKKFRALKILLNISVHNKKYHIVIVCKYSQNTNFTIIYIYIYILLRTVIYILLYFNSNTIFLTTDIQRSITNHNISFIR